MTTLITSPVPNAPLVMLPTAELYRLRQLWVVHSDPDCNGILAKIDRELDIREES